MKKLQFVAVFLAALLMTMPVAFAQELSITVSGRDRSSGNARVKDTLIAEGIAAIPGETIISPEQVRIYYGDAFAFFDNCTRMAGDANNYRCTFTDDSFEAYEPLTFRLELRNDDDKIVKSETKNLRIDGLPPQIVAYNVTPIHSTGEVAVRLSAHDYGLTHGQPQDCSGIKKITLTLNGKPVLEETGQPGICSKDRQIPVRLTESGGLCAYATDFVNQESLPSCQQIIIDSTPPDIREPSIVDSKGVRLTHIRKGQDTIATVTVEIIDEIGVDSKEIKADLSSIAPSLSGLRTPDRIAGNIAIWQNVPVVEPSICKITVTAKDKLGNAAAKDYSCSVKSDNVGPQFVRVVSERFRSNVPLLGRGTALTLEFDEKDDSGGAGIGINRRLAALDLSELGLPNFVQAGYCAPFEGSIWRCTWTINPPKGTPEGGYTVTVLSGSADDLDNTAGKETAVPIVYDDSPPAPPRIISSRIIKGEDNPNITGAVRGNFAQYVVSSANFTDAYANFSEIGGKTVPGICGVPENDTSTIECTFESKIELSGPYLATIPFVFTDDAGNVANTSAALEVFGLDNETRGQYWIPRVTCTPKLINRATASLIPPYASCSVELTSTRRDVEPYRIRGPENPSECIGDLENVVSDVYTSNVQEGSRNPLVVFKLEAKNYYLNSVNVTCPMTILTKRAIPGGGVISPQPQVIKVPYFAEFYNQPQEDMYAEVDKQIERAMDDALANADWLGTLRKALYYFELLCIVKSIVSSLINVLTIINAALGTMRDGLLNTGIGAPAAAGVAGVNAALCGTNTATQGTFQSIGEALSLFCFFINCGGEVKGSVTEEQQTPTGKVGDDGKPITTPQEVAKIDPETGKQEQTSGQAFTSYFSGGINPLCSKASEVLGLGMPSIKDSLVWSVFCLCLPGIVYNVEKLRQVNCFKAVCLHDEVKERGYPISYCQEMYQYNLCQYVIGQVFAAIPFAQFANRVAGMLTELLSNPVAVVTVGLTLLCMPMCSIYETSPAFTACAVFRTISLVAEAVTSTVSMARTKNLFKSVPGQYCKRMEDIQEDMEKEEKERQAAEGGEGG